ncbi:hypothetical protein GR183_16700 [Stappia sp. GBMRC 2046]|uniref:Uncharacterized protein n=1 Tax=Stappia sediminis TaxID=2692190 RepID=A0A7X3S966_9HYPH|nr:hypothetical protein [Stappia sediminis]MXN66557.1 hypothetical protein [Stappia sediminis]
MRKSSILISAAIIFGFTGSALAAPNANSQSTGNPGNGNQGCGYGDPNFFKNPGDLFKFIRENNGQNPKEFITENIIIDDPETVGEYLNNICKGTDPS